MLGFVPGTLIVVGFVVLGVVLLAYAFYFLVIKKWYWPYNPGLERQCS